jgi:predicted PurR-regulated permease PerM
VTKRVAFYVLLALLATLSAVMLVPVFVPVMVSMILGYLLLPIHERLGRAISSPDLRAAALVLLVLFALALPVLLVVVQVADEIPNALKAADLSHAAAKINQWLDRTLNRHVPLSENLETYLARVRDAALRAAPSIIGAVGNTALGLFVMLYTLFYVLRDGKQVWRDFVILLPLQEEVKPLLVRDLRQTLSGVLYGQLVTAAAQALLAAIGYAIFHVPNVLFWSFLTLIASMIPFAGSTIVWLPLAISRLAAGDKVGGIGLLIYGGLLVMNVDNIIKPRLIAGRSQLHPVAALLGVIGGLHLFGVIGFLLGPVLLSLVVAMLRFHRDVSVYQLASKANAAADQQP